MTIGKVNNTPYSSNLADNSLIINGYHATYQFDTTSNPPTPENPNQVYRKLTNRSFDENSLYRMDELKASGMRFWRL